MSRALVTTNTIPANCIEQARGNNLLIDKEGLQKNAGRRVPAARVNCYSRVQQLVQE
jgi:hypothetical protein